MAGSIFHKITWECGVGLLDRGTSPVAWNQSATRPAWDFNNPILPLHWSNLLHLDLAGNNDVIDRWADFLLAATTRLDCLLAENIDSCWQQTAVCRLAAMQVKNQQVLVDLRRIPDDIACRCHTFFLKIQGSQPLSVQCRGAQILSRRHDRPDLQTLSLLPDQGQK